MTKHFPEKLKHAHVIQNLKGGDKMIRTITVPYQFSQRSRSFFERHISNQLQEYFQNNDLIHEYQSGFRKKSLMSYRAYTSH